MTKRAPARPALDISNEAREGEQAATDTREACKEGLADPAQRQERS